MVQVEGLRIASLPVEVVLQFPPVAKVAAAVAAMDGSTVSGVIGDVQLDCPARLTVELVVEPLGSIGPGPPVSPLYRPQRLRSSKFTGGH